MYTTYITITLHILKYSVVGFESLVAILAQQEYTYHTMKNQQLIDVAG